jgi:hypothetical protein
MFQHPEAIPGICMALFFNNLYLIRMIMRSLLSKELNAGILQTMLDEAEQQAGTGSWLFDPQSGHFSFSPNFWRLTGIGQGSQKQLTELAPGFTRPTGLHCSRLQMRLPAGSMFRTLNSGCW